MFWTALLVSLAVPAPVWIHSVLALLSHTNPSTRAVHRDLEQLPAASHHPENVLLLQSFTLNIPGFV